MARVRGGSRMTVWGWGTIFHIAPLLKVSEQLLRKSTLAASPQALRLLWAVPGWTCKLGRGQVESTRGSMNPAGVGEAPPGWWTTEKEYHRMVTFISDPASSVWAGSGLG